MLSVVNSGKFILTLQSTPPFVIESIFAVALAILLAVPLITNLQFYLEKASKGKKNIRNSTIADIPLTESNRAHENHNGTNGNENSSEQQIRRAVVMHYPAPISIDTSSSSDLDPRVGTLSRKSVSTPNVRSNCNKDGWSKNGNYKSVIQRNDQQCVHEVAKMIKPEKDALLGGSSSFVATNAELPIIDISTFNYNSYRHKLIEASLKKRYRERQPPGDVIFNSIHLNTTDSTLGIRLNEEYDHSFFDFVEEYYDATTGMSKKEMEFLHPLDHFLVRNGCKREISEKATETTNFTENQTDQRRSLIDNKPIDRHDLDKNGNISKLKSKNFSKNSKKPDDELSRSMDKRKNFEENGGAPAAQLVDFNSIDTRVRATALCLDGAGREKSPGRKLSSKTLNSHMPTSLVVQAGKNSNNVSSSSSSSDEYGGAYTETEKQPHKATSNHSRDSSAPPSRGRTTNRKLLPWITGNPKVSFNRKYGNRSPEAFDGSTKRKVRSSERPSTRFHLGTNTLRPRSANLSTTSRKTNYQNSLESEETVRDIGNYTASKKTFNRSNKPEISSSSLGTPLVSILPSRNSSKSSSKLFVSLKDNSYRKIVSENVTDRSYAKFKEKRDRADKAKTMKATVQEDNKKITSEVNHQDQAIITINSGLLNSDNRSNKTMTSDASDRTNSKTIRVARESVINKTESWKESALRRRNNESEPRNDILPKKEIRRRLEVSPSNLDKRREFPRENKSDCNSKNEDCSRSVIESSDTLVLVKNDSRAEKCSSSSQILSKENDAANAKILANEENISEELKLPGNDSKIGLAVRTSLKNYIKTLKQVLKNGGNVDMVDLASLSLKDAISPELESILSSAELKELQDLLNIAEIKSNLAAEDVVVV